MLTNQPFIKLFFYFYFLTLALVFRAHKLKEHICQLKKSHCIEIVNIPCLNHRRRCNKTAVCITLQLIELLLTLELQQFYGFLHLEIGYFAKCVYFSIKKIKLCNSKTTMSIKLLN